MKGRAETKGQLINEIVKMQERITELGKSEEALWQSFDKLPRITEGALLVLGKIVEMRDPYTAYHQQRVAKLSCAIAEEMALSEEQINVIYIAAVIHDVGKISIPVEILSKPGQLNKIESDLIKTHPEVSFNILKIIKFPWLVAQIVLQHHERVNGSGYPQGLFGKDILLEARILSVADVIEAMSSHRPYRPALGIGKALEEISQNKGILYDSQIVDVCFKLFSEKRFKFE